MVGIFDPTATSEKKKENLLTAIFIGAIFIAVAAIYFSHLPNNLWDDIVSFFSQLTLSPIPGTSIPLPAPGDLSANAELYYAAFEFTLAIGLMEIGILLLRVYFHSPVARKAETVENIVFWLGASYLIVAYLVNMTIYAEWFVFWAGIIMLFGLALVARSFILLAKR